MTEKEFVGKFSGLPPHLLKLMRLRDYAEHAVEVEDNAQLQSTAKAYLDARLNFLRTLPISGD